MLYIDKELLILISYDILGDHSRVSYMFFLDCRLPLCYSRYITRVLEYLVPSKNPSLEMERRILALVEYLPTYMLNTYKVSIS